MCIWIKIKMKYLILTMFCLTTVLFTTILCSVEVAQGHLLNWIHFNPAMDKYPNAQWSLGWYYLFIPKLKRLYLWSLGLNQYFHPTLDNGFKTGLRLTHISKGCPKIYERAAEVIAHHSVFILMYPTVQWKGISSTCSSVKTHQWISLCT